MAVEWTSVALADFEAIWEYIDRDRGSETANRVSERIYDVVGRLGAMPYQGRAGRMEKTRELVVPRLPYVVVYQVVDDERVRILNILHGAQRWP